MSFICERSTNKSDTIYIYHIIGYHIIGYHIIGYHIIGYHIIGYHIIGFHIIGYHIIGYHITRLEYIIEYYNVFIEKWAHYDPYPDIGPDP